MTYRSIAISLVALTAAACSPAQEEAETPTTVLTMHEVMKDQIDANADALWDLTNPALNDTASFDPAKLDQAAWSRIVELSGNVEAGGRALAAMDPIMVARPGVKISDEDVESGHSAAQVQGFVDADPSNFRNLATTLGDHMAAISAAAGARDPIATASLVDQLDGVCESCHLQYWYPEQAELVRGIRAAGGDDPAASTQ